MGSQSGMGSTTGSQRPKAVDEDLEDNEGDLGSSSDSSRANRGGQSDRKR